MEALETFWNAILNTPPVEFIAVLTGIAYVILAARRMILCWLFAFISSVLYVYICFQYKLYIESVLQVFYVVMAVIGWLNWKQSTESAADEVEQSGSDVRTWGWKFNALNIAASGLVTLAVGWSFATWTDQANPYLDAFTTVFSLVATFMVTRKVFETWIYWIVIDFIGILLYYSRGLNLSALLFVFLTAVAIYGLFSWYKQYKLRLA